MLANTEYMNTSKQLAKNTFIIFLGKAFTQLLSFFLLPLYTAILSTEDYGFADFVFTIGSLIVPIMIFQLDAGLFRALIDIRDNRQKIKDTTVAVFCLSFLFCCIYSIVYIIMCEYISIRFNYLILFYVQTAVALNLILQFYRGTGNVLIYSALCCVNGFSTICANVLFLLLFKMGIAGMILAYVFGQSVAFFVGFVKFFIEFKDCKFNIRLRKTVCILRYSIPLIFNSVSWWIMNASDRIVIISIMGLEYNGIYAVANKFSSVMFSAYSIFNLSWTEIVSTKYVNSGIDKEIINLNKKINIAILYVCGLSISSMYIIYPLLIDESYMDGFYYIPILITAVYFNCLGAQLGGLLVARKESKIIAVTSVIGAVLNILINVMLIRFIGLYAAAGSTLFSFGVMYFMRRISLRDELGMIVIKEYIVPLLLFGIGVIVFYFNENAISTLFFFIYVIVMMYTYKKEVYQALQIFDRMRGDKE